MPPDRRQFFREALRSVVRPMVDMLEHRQVPGTAPDPRLLRPPGAILEALFPDTCRRCGECVAVCPARAIRPLVSSDDRMNGTPIVDADLAACVVCDDLACMKACPTGALRLVAVPTDIRMGTARVDLDTCVRSHGEDCRECVTLCPFGADAIKLDEDGRVEVLADGCVGCGVCQFHCPTRPQRAIVVEPRQC